MARRRIVPSLTQAVLWSLVAIIGATEGDHNESTTAATRDARWAPAASVSVEITKPTKNTRLGIGLAPKKGTSETRVTEIRSDSVFFGTGLRVGMVLESVNGERCGGLESCVRRLTSSEGRVVVTASQQALLDVPEPIVSEGEDFIDSKDVKYDKSTTAAAYDLAYRTLERILLDTPEPVIDTGEDVVDAKDVNQNSLAGEAAADSAAANDNAPAEESSAQHDDNVTYDGSDLVEWINSNGGFVHPNARIGVDPSGQYHGVFVRTEEEGGTADGIKEGEITTRIPWDLIIKPKDYSKDTYWSCDAVRELHRQLILGDESKYAPYINYLKSQPRGFIPSDWSDEGKRLLMKITDYSKNVGVGSGLPPHHSFEDFEDTWMEECGGEDTELERLAYFQFTSRDEDTLMVPFFDMHNHSNDPKKLNVLQEKPKREGEPFLMRATRDIKLGEQMYTSYNRCHPCWHDVAYEGCTTWGHYGTPQVFRSFGFVEDFPQYWSFKSDIGERDGFGDVKLDELKLCLERPDDAGPFFVKFGNNYREEMPSEAHIRHLGGHLLRLEELESGARSDAELMRKMPEHEWDTAWKYHERLMTTISAAILGADDFEDDPEGGGTTRKRLSRTKGDESVKDEL